MNLLNLFPSNDRNEAKTYSSKMRPVKVVLIVFAFVFVVPSSYTNFIFIYNFFGVPESQILTALAWGLALGLDLAKILVLSTFFSILIGSYFDGEKDIEGISLFLSIAIFLLSLFFSKKGLEMAEFNKQVEQTITIEEKDPQKAIIKLGSKADDRNKRKTAIANAKIIEEINKANELSIKKAELELKNKQEINNIKGKLIDNKFTFLCISELIGLISCISLTYLAERRRLEEETFEDKGELTEEDKRKLRNAYYQAERRQSPRAQELKRLLEKHGVDVPKVGSRAGI